MKVEFSSASRDGDHLQDAFTLIELIGVLAVIAILAAIIVPNLLHQLDLAAGQQEVATLQGFGSALQSSISRNFYVPGTNDWASNIAAEVGTGTYEVATNSRGLRRVFLIDPAFQIGTNGHGLPYTQNINGSTVTNSFGTVIPPVSPRLMILSSIGIQSPSISSTVTGLPTNVVSGVPAVSNDFATIWNTEDGTPPTSATGFSSWTAINASDLKIQRINLSPLFVQLALSTYASATNGNYAINPATFSGTNSATTNNGGVTAYYIQNSVLRLLNEPSNMVSSDQILIHNSSFVYYQNAWLASISSTNATSSGASASIGADFSTIVANFLSAPTNGQALSGATQALVTQDMINYLNAYDAWATSGTFAANAQYTNALNLQGTLATDIGNLINGL
jgi:prepilin-type N-terminal cleavage/methylation domain-containing protein